MNACRSETLFWKEQTSSIRGAQRRGCLDFASRYIVADLESTPAEFSCSRGTGGRSIPLHNVWRGIRPMLYHQIQIVIQFREGCKKQSDFIAHKTSDRCPGCRALVSGGRAQGHGKARLRTAASRIDDAPTGRALKRVRFATDRVEDDAETPGDTSTSAPSSLPAEDAATIFFFCQHVHLGLCFPRLQSERLIKV